MKLAKIGNILILNLLGAALFAISALADPSITVVVTPNPLSRDDNLQLRIQINSENADAISAPTFEAPDFTQVGSSSSTSVSSEYVNGHISMVERVIYTYILQPEKEGALKISGIGVDIAGKHISSNDQMIKVLPSNGNNGQSPAKQNNEEEQNPAAPSQFQSRNTSGANAPDRLNSDFTVHVQLDKKTAYVGEPITAEYWLYDFGGLQNVDVQKWPTFTGFWKEDLQINTRYQFQDTYVQNQRARKAMLGRFALYAIKPGKLPIDRLVINGKYLSRNMMNQGDDVFNFFLGSIGQLRSGTHGSEEVSVEILPLPEQGRPASFSGAVGKFRMGLSADKLTAQANTPINLSLTIEGAGNFQAIDQFKLPLPGDFELYESNTSVNGSAPLGGTRTLENKKTFHYLVLPRKAGKFTIPAVEWSYFDPEKKAYQVVNTNPIALDITPDDGTHQTNTYGGGGGSAANEAAAPPTASAKLELRYLKPVEDIYNGGFAKLPKAVNIFLALANLLFFGALGRRYFEKKNPLERITNAPKRRLAALIESLEKNSKNRTEHFLALESAMQEILEILLGKNTLGMIRDEVEQEWRERHYPAELYHRIQAMLDLAARERYAGNRSAALEDATKKKNLEELRMIVNKATSLV